MRMKLQDILGSARRAKGVTLREVERATGISNAYVSQLETGAVEEPSPRKLRTLAAYYGVSYDSLMSACDYGPATGAVETNSAGVYFLGERLTREESAAMASFLNYLRQRSTKSSP
jgi:transcriptional regulator with XRE-family HTH domain